MVGRSGKGISGRGKGMLQGPEIGETWCALKNLETPMVRNVYLE